MLMVNTANAEVDETLKAKAEEYSTILEKGNWILVPRQANFPKTITFMDMREDLNYFKFINDTLDVRIDFMGTRVTHALSEEQLFWLAEENADLLYLLETAPPFFQSQCTAIKKNVRISKNCKTVTMEVSCRTNDKNFNDYNSIPSFTIRVDVKSGTAQITCRGMRYDETFEGLFYKVEFDRN